MNEELDRLARLITRLKERGRYQQAYDLLPAYSLAFSARLKLDALSYARSHHRRNIKRFKKELEYLMAQEENVA